MAERAGTRVKPMPSASQEILVLRVPTQHYLLLQRNLVYRGITRGKKLVVLIGQRKALGIAVRNNRTESRFSGLLERLKVCRGPGTRLAGAS